MNALNLKVIIRIDEGLVKPIDKARGGVNRTGHRQCGMRSGSSHLPGP